VPEVYGPNIIGLAAMFCPPRGLGATERDFQLLCWELFSLQSFASAGGPDADTELRRIEGRWDELLGNTPFGRLRADPRVAHQVRGVWMNGRLRANTHQAGISASADILRVALLHEAMAELAPNAQRFCELRDRFFSNDVFRVLRQVATVISTASNAPPEVCPGRLDVFSDDTGNDDVVDFVHFGQLACTPSSDVAAMAATLRALPEHERKFNPSSDPLSLRPGMLLDDRGDRRAFFYPAPRRLVRVSRRLFLDDFVDFLPKEPPLEPTSLFGGALHRHLAEVLGDRALIVGDDCPVRGMKPDALWCGERLGVVVEGKARLTPRTDPNCLAPDSLLLAWQRAFEAVDQASAFLRDPVAREWVAARVGRLPSKWVLAILVDERGVAERTQFRHATARWGLLTGTDLEGVALLTVECLEAAVRTQTADALGEWIESAWRDSAADALDQPPEEPDLPPVEDVPYLKRANDLLVR
jgi:hypothetical protein